MKQWIIILFANVLFVLLGIGIGNSVFSKKNSKAPQHSAYVGSSNTTSSIELGKKSYSRNCQSCHGINGVGGSGLNISNVLSKMSVSELSDTILQGNPKKGMPAWENDIPNSELKHLVLYIKSFQKVKN